MLQGVFLQYLGRPSLIAADATWALLAVLSVYGTLTIAILEFPLSAVYLLFIGFSGPCLLGNFFIRTILTQFE